MTNSRWRRGIAGPIGTGVMGAISGALRLATLGGLVAVLSLAACSRDDNPVETPVGTRPYKMGFSFFPTLYQSVDANQFIANFNARSDLITIHWSGDVPWELIDSCPDLDNCNPVSNANLLFINDNLQAAITGLQTYTGAFKAASNKRVYLAMSPLSNERDSVAYLYGNRQSNPPANTFTDPTIRASYKLFVTYMIDKFQPDYFSQAIETNMYVDHNRPDYPHLISLLAEIKAELAVSHPNLLVAPTIQWEFYRDSWLDPAEQPLLDSMMSRWTDLGDYYPISTYPNVKLNLGSVDSTLYRFDQFGIDLAADAKVMISECGTQPNLQADMLRVLSDFLQAHEPIAIDYFFLEDMDHLPFPPSFLDIGLYNDAASPALTPHPGLAVWDSLFAH